MSLPTIQINLRQHRDVLQDCWDAVIAKNDPPTLFLRDGVLTHLITSSGLPRLEIVNSDRMYGILLHSADFVNSRPTGQAAARPDIMLAKTMVSLPDPRLPIIEEISSVPMVDPRTGMLWLDDGYSPSLRTYFNGVSQLKGIGGEEEADSANQCGSFIISEVFGDFPLEKETEAAHILATLLLPFVRKLINGVTPIHLFEANGPGSGKTLMANIITLITTGEILAPISPSSNEEEMRKRITSLLLEGKNIIVLDNLNAELNSGVLASAITGERWSDRPLGFSKIVNLPNKATWIVTGNNPRLSLEVARRCARVRLTPIGAKPWERTAESYRHADIIHWCREHRGLIIGKIYKMIRSWWDAGKPKCSRSLGSFEGWVDVIGGIIEHAGIKGFLENCGDLYETSDPLTQEWEEFVETWWEEAKGKWQSPSEILLIAQAREMLPETLGGGMAQSQRIRLGRALSNRRDCYIGEFKIERKKSDRAKTVLYRLVGKPIQKEIGCE